MSDLKNIQAFLPLKMTMIGNSQKSLINNHNSNDTSFEELLTASLKQLYSKDVSLKKQTANEPMPLFYSLRAFDLDDNVKFKESLKTVLKYEGTRLVKEDGGRKESSKYGILESTAKELGYKGNIRSLTMADVETIYRKIWNKSGAGSLPYPLSVVHFDTYVNSPAMAKKILLQSNGNVDKYLGLRLERYNRLAQLKPERYGKYLNGWTNRIKSLKVIANSSFDKQNEYISKRM
jgi:lysozyme family protein